MVTQPQPAESDKQTLERLNQEYVDAFMNADLEWYREHLADEFVCIESDGSMLHKQQFLANTAKGPDVTEYDLDHVDVRIYGDTAVVLATGFWISRNGSPGMSRYIDVYVKREHKWKAVSAQITRSSRMGPRGPYKRGT